VPLKVRNAAEFSRLVNALADDIVTAAIHLRLLRDLHRSVRKYVRELNQSPAFWSLTFRAHSDCAMLALCRIYDSHEKSLNIRNLIDVAMANPDWFSTEQFRLRKKDNPYVDSLAETDRLPKKSRIRADLKFCSGPLVSRLQIWRHQAVAHRSREHALDPAAAIARSPISIKDMQKLADRAARMVNYYSQLFDANSYMTRIVGHDDYIQVLESVRERMRSIEGGITEELRQAGYTRSGQPIARRRKQTAN
jgi:hypothetical protein